MIKKTENGGWRVRIYHHSVQVATATLPTKRSAEEWEKSQKSALSLGTWTDPRLGSTPLGEVVAKFNESRVSAIRKHSYDTDETNLRIHIPRRMMLRPVNSIRKTDLEDIYGEMLRTKARSTVSRFRDSMLALLGYAARRGYVGENQARSSKVPKGNGAVADKVRPFSRAELRSLIDAASSTHSEYANLIEFAALTGARWGELAALRVSDLRSAQISEVVIARSKSDGYAVAAPKSGKTRVVPLLRRAHEIGQIQSAGKKPGDLLFRAPRGGPVNAGNLKRAVDWDSNTPDHRFHDLRHTAATTWINNGLDVKTVSVWLGHATSAITHRTYAGWLGADANADAIARLEESLRREGGQP